MDRFIVAALLLALVVGFANAAAPKDDSKSALQQRAVAALRKALSDGARWVKVHAAESLLELGYPQGVAEEFANELKQFGAEPEYRIGIWRVLARMAPDAQQRSQWVDKIRSAAADKTGKDRTHAFETLAKLGARIESAQRESLTPDEETSLPFWLWALVGGGESTNKETLAKLFYADHPVTRARAAYAFRFLRDATPEHWEQLATAAEKEPDNSPARVNLLSAAYVLAPNAADQAKYKTALAKYLTTGTVGARREAAAALGEKGDATDLAVLEPLLDDADLDVQAGGADAILRIQRRAPHSLASLDWMILVLYLGGMLGIGVYYSWKTTTAEEYLLGGREMSPWAVGLSLFATLISTISYLSWPGETIKHGPMMFAAVLAYPFISVVVGRLLIPCFMRLKVTSAYEILELRLGLSVRMLGSIFFLMLRLLWMAVIVDATTGVVLLPMLGLDPSATPYVGAALGIVTVIYTSLGGIRAVVITDVIQTFILLGGAFAALGLVTYEMGGVSAWWPTQWAPNWDPLIIGYDPNARVTILSAFVSTFMWYICTAGSDQMAIQRYLSTRDAASARRMFNISLWTNAIVFLVLAMIGLALLAYFRVRPDLLAEGQSVTANADQLFPRFIAVALPSGISGLVIAGLLAAAMSSLSSGLNSCCSVISVDFIDRFRPAPTSAEDQLRRTRNISWFVGVAVVALSLVVGAIEGNLFEVAFKVVNLLVAPLFGLFFMALFVSWATSFGALVGAMVGLTTVVAVSYWKQLTGVPGISFLWAMPVGLTLQILAGSLASLIPVGRTQAISIQALRGQPEG